MEPLLVLLDTNAALFPFERSLDLLGELQRILDEKFEVAILDVCVKELEHQASSAQKTRRIAVAALQWLKKAGIKRVHSGMKGDADPAIIAFAAAYKGPIAVLTQDQAIKRALQAKGIPRIIIRQQQHLLLQI